MVNHHVRPLIGWSERMRDLHAEIEKTAPTNLTVMIRGERGTGKELVARAIHLKATAQNARIGWRTGRRRAAAGSKRRRMQLDAMNCKQEGNAQRRTHPIASKCEMLEGGPAQL